ncbi:MAG: FAD-dependent thymidylate synthase [Nitrospinota bacterium]|nr:MAG: FAD-dependent thymidylate synthase [Nitrospinota bacterium]
MVVPAAEAILDKEFPVLNHGFVRLVDYLGGDARIVQAARVSYGPGTKTFREDRALIHYLMRNRHTSPFEQVILTFHVKLPLFVARQWIRHRTARVNEISGRYSILPDEFYLPAPDAIRYQSTRNKQGRGEEMVPPELQQRVLEILCQGQASLYADYQALLQENIARELARINLPLSLYTQWYWQIDLHNLFHFLKLRLDPHAQLEIREYARVLANITKTVAPIAYEAFEEYVLYGVNFSRTEMEALRAILRGEENPLTGRARQLFEEKLNPAEQERPHQ